MVSEGLTYVFKKSGNEVKAIARTDYAEKGNWIVERTDGASKGKRLIAHERNLVRSLED